MADILGEENLRKLVASFFVDHIGPFLIEEQLLPITSYDLTELSNLHRKRIGSYELFYDHMAIKYSGFLFLVSPLRRGNFTIHYYIQKHLFLGSGAYGQEYREHKIDWERVEYEEEKSRTIIENLKSYGYITIAKQIYDRLFDTKEYKISEESGSEEEEEEEYELSLLYVMVRIIEGEYHPEVLLLGKNLLSDNLSLMISLKFDIHKPAEYLPGTGTRYEEAKMTFETIAKR